MLEKIINSTLRQKGFVLAISVILVIAGTYTYLNLPVDAFPDVTNNQVEIVCHADGLSAVEIERNVTYPIEMAMRGLPRVTQMRSVTKFGIAIVTLIFEDNADIYFARQQVFERMAEARENVPRGVEIALGPVATAMGEIYQYTLQTKLPDDSAGRVHKLMELRSLEEWVIAPLLKGVAGVNEINSFGGYLKEYQVIVKPEQLVKFGLSIDDVYSAIESNNQNAGGNVLERGADQYIVRGVGLIRGIEDIEKTVLKSVKGIPVLVNEVADVKIGSSVRMGAATLNGKEEVVGGIVMMLRGENGREVTRRVKEKVDEINSGSILPQDVKLVPYYDRSDIVNASMKTVNRALLEGGILVLIVLYVLLRSFRSSLVVLLALPLSLFITFILMRAIGLGANLMSLGGLAITIGMIIDATIIQVENVQRHLSLSGVNNKDARIILRAVLEVRKPSILGEIIIAIAFIPILSLEGIEGKMFGPLAETVALALFASLILSIFIVPVLCYIFLKPEPEKESAVMHVLSRVYANVLHVVTEKRKWLMGGLTALLLTAAILASRLGTEFIPIMDEGAFDMDVSLLPGVSLSKALEINDKIVQKLKQFPELETVVGRTGQTGIALDTRGPEKTGYVGILRPRSEWKRDISRDELMNEMRDSLAGIPGIGFGFSQPIQCRIDELVAGTRAQLIIKLFGADINVLAAKASEIAAVLSTIEGTADLMAEKTTGQPYLTVTIDRARIARYGLTISDVQKVIEIAIAGKAASKFYEEDRNYNITVRLPEARRNSVETIENILVPVKNGPAIPLAQLATIAFVEGPVQISREDGMRRVGIELNITGRDIGTYVTEAKSKITKEVNLPQGYYLKWGGQFENQQRAMHKLMIIGPVVILIILFLLFITFRSMSMSLLILCNLPFALVGGVISLYISGLYLSVPASVGFIVLFGVAVLNGVVLVSHILHLRAQGLSVQDAVARGSADRLRPVIMTALIAIFSLIPMIFASGTGSEIQKPLAIVVCGGLITSTILTLLVIPVVYPLFERLQNSGQALK
ncbi:MAG: CusA/CzcA family heavy metal efflux RND transporter [Ignavibacteria bacterium]|nr:CusA/CzcA family heavy metal efflux RND transporter [Ignavibacteria bacterium]